MGTESRWSPVGSRANRCGEGSGEPNACVHASQRWSGICGAWYRLSSGKGEGVWLAQAVRKTSYCRPPLPGYRRDNMHVKAVQRVLMPALRFPRYVPRAAIRSDEMHMPCPRGLPPASLERMRALPGPLHPPLLCPHARAAAAAHPRVRSKGLRSQWRTAAGHCPGPGALQEGWALCWWACYRRRSVAAATADARFEPASWKKQME